MKREKPEKPKKQRGCGTFLLVSAVLLLLIRSALYDGLVVREYTVTSPYVTGAHTYALLTDLHSTVYGEAQEVLADKIRESAPEAVFFSGDIADDKEGFYGTALLLEQLAGMECWYVTGNHERWVDYTDNIKALFEQYGVTVLSGSSVLLGDGVRLWGIDDPLFYEDTNAYLAALRELGEQADGEFCDVLLSHRPEFASIYADCGFDVTLCGHAHGGQVRFPLFVNGLYAPNQGWFPEHAGGRYDFDGGCVIVSRGLVKNDLPRVFNPPELVILHVNEDR